MQAVTPAAPLAALRVPAAALGCMTRAWCIVLPVAGSGAALVASHGASWGLGALVVLAVLSAAGTRARRSHPDAGLPNDKAAWGVAVLAAAALAGFAWAIRFDSLQVSDFGVYFRCGAESRSPFAQWLAACQSHYLRANTLYWLRSLLYAAPFGYLFGGDYAALKLYNASWHAVTLGALYWGLKRAWGAMAALAGVLALVSYPEWWFTLTLATPDNAALACIVLFALALARLATSERPLAWSAVAAAALIAAQQLRTVGAVLLLALAGWTLWAMARDAARAARVLRSGLLVAGIYVAAEFILQRAAAFPGAEPVTLLRALSALQIDSAQDFTVNYAWYEHFWPAIARDWQARVAAARLWAELVTGLPAYPSYLLRKAAVFFSGAGYQVFATAGFDGNLDTVRNVGIGTVPSSAAQRPWLALVVAVQVCTAGWVLLTRPLDPLSAAAAFVLAAFLLVVVGLGEAQPRYSVLVAPSIAVLVASAMRPAGVRLRAGRGFPQRLALAAAAPAAIGLAILLALYLAGAVASHLLVGSLPHPFDSAVQQNAPSSDGGGCDAQPARLERDRRRLRVSLPPGASCVRVRIEVPPDARFATFFVAQPRMPFPFEGRSVSPYRYRILDGAGAQRDAGSLGPDAVRWLRVPVGRSLGDGASNALVIEIARDAGLPDDGSPLDLWFMQFH